MVTVSLCSTERVNTVWDREDEEFNFVSCVALTCNPRSIMDMTSLIDATGTCVRF